LKKRKDKGKKRKGASKMKKPDREKNWKTWKPGGSPAQVREKKRGARAQRYDQEPIKLRGRGSR